MGITLEMVIGVVVLTALALLLTGPGMWSEKWGWKFLRGKEGSSKRSPPRDPPGGAGPTGGR